MSNANINRADLMRACAIVRPALATQPLIPALTCIHFNGKDNLLTAYDDRMAITVYCDTQGVDGLVNGALLISALSSFGGETVLFQRAKDGYLVKSGHGSVKLPQRMEEFPFDWPDTAGASEVEVDEGIITGIERCLISVSNDAKPRSLAVTAVTMDAVKGRAVLFSTDDRSMSRYATAEKVTLPGDAPVIMPRAFCEQMVALSKAFPKAEATLYLLPDCILAEFFEGKESRVRLFSRIPDGVEALPFAEQFAKHINPDPDNARAVLHDIPASFDAALGRSLLVLTGEAFRKASLTATHKGLRLETATSIGEADDTCEGSMKEQHGGTVLVDPWFLQRAAKVSALMTVTKRATIFADKDCRFIHLVAHLG